MIDIFAIFRRCDTDWHPCRHTIFPRRDINGEWLLGDGQLWRRRHNGKMEYRCDYTDDIDTRAW